MAAKIPDNVRIAIAAALAAGITQHVIAKQYGVSRTTVAVIKAMGQSVQNDANVLNRDWRTEHAGLYVNAITDKMSKIEDPAKAVNAAQQGLKGLGLMFSDTQINVKLEAWLGSPIAAQIVREHTTTCSEAPGLHNAPCANIEASTTTSSVSED